MVPILYRFPLEESARLEAVAKKSGHTLSSLTRYVMAQYVANLNPEA